MHTLINSYIEQLHYREPIRLYEPISYVLSLGGKRIRPTLMLMAYKLFKTDFETILPQAIALEVYHNFTLLHDDLMDCADLRRGHETVHKKWDDNTAILSGDAMLIMAYKLFTEAANSQQLTRNSFLKGIQTFNEATLGVCEGQQYDIDFETRNDVAEEEYIEMIRLKTSLLLACALKIGAQLADASDEDANLLYDFGEKMGLAFQLQDDLLDVYGDPKVFGKNIGGDILCNKKTFMLINALRLTKGTDRKALQNWINEEDFDPDEKIEAVTTIYNKVGIRTLCEMKIEEYFSLALESLEKVNVESTLKQDLRNFAKKLLKRNF